MTARTLQRIFAKEKKLLIGWNEWCELPDLGIPAMKAKIDTGAKTSAIHAFNLKKIKRHGHDYARFDLHPLQGNTKITRRCEGRIVDQRYVMSSNGHKENRFVIKTSIKINHLTWEIELTLSNRDPLKFRMLLGREALGGRLLIDPFHRLLQGKISKSELRALYSH